MCMPYCLCFMNEVMEVQRNDSLKSSKDPISDKQDSFITQQHSVELFYKQKSAKDDIVSYFWGRKFRRGMLLESLSSNVHH